jgi:hypothetical protein
MRRSPLLILLVACILARPGSALAAEAVAPASPETADAITTAALAGVQARLRSDGLFDDPTGRTVGAGGLPSLAWASLSAQGAPTAARLALTRATLAHGSGTTVVLRWPLAMLVADDPPGLPAADRTELRGRVATWGKLHAAGIADRCYVQPACFNNYKLVDQVLNLELARSGVTSTAPNTRLRDPRALRRVALAWLDRVLPSQTPATATVGVPGRRTERGSVLSDPGAMPLAYHALCTAWVVRAVELAGADASPALRSVARRTLWALVGVAAPDGEVAWSGRGQDQAWSLAAALYASAAGSRAFADTDPVLAARLRRLADVELTALDGRARDGALQVLPSGNDQLSGLDHYYSGVGSMGLALQWLGMARDELPDPGAPRLGLPAEIDGATFADPGRTGLLARREGRGWLGMRLRRDHAFDPRQDFGLVRALHVEADGWHEDRVARPGPVSAAGRPAQRVPSAGPLLVAGRRAFWPEATSWVPIAHGVELRGQWHSRDGRSLFARWRITASDAGPALSTPCARGAALQLTEWLPRRGAVVRGKRFVSRAGYAVKLSSTPTLRPLTTRWANARQPSLAAVRLAEPCRAGAWTTVRWSGGATAEG